MITFMKTSTWEKIQTQIHNLKVEVKTHKAASEVYTAKIHSLQQESVSLHKVKELAQLMNKLDIKKLIINQEKGTTMLERNFKDSKK